MTYDETQPSDPREAHAAASAARAHAKAMRPWYRKKRWWAAGIIVVVIGASAIAGIAGEDDATEPAAGDSAAEAEATEADDDADETDTRNLDRYPDRPDRQDQDHEAAIGDSVRLAGYTATVEGAQIVNDPVWGEQLHVSVTVENRDDRAQHYNTFDWRLQDASGRVVDPTIGDNIGSGDLVEGGTVSGTVAFDAGPGTYFVIYKPDPLNAARGIWQIDV
jgi:hypothetical protein